MGSKTLRNMTAALRRMDDRAAAGLSGLGGMILIIIAGILIPVVAMEVLAGLLPDYFTSLSSLFTSLAAVNTTGWPTVVALIFDFLPLILGVTAIAAVLGLGAFLTIRARRTA